MPTQTQGPSRCAKLRTMTLKIYYVLLFALILVNCKSKSSENNTKSMKNVQSLASDFMSDTSIFPRIYVDQNENITLNGNASTIEEVDNKLLKVKNANGIVFYSTDNATASPPKNGTVIELIKKYQLPIKMYADKNFSKPLY